MDIHFVPYDTHESLAGNIGNDLRVHLIFSLQDAENRYFLLGGASAEILAMSTKVTFIEFNLSLKDTLVGLAVPGNVRSDGFVHSVGGMAVEFESFCAGRRGEFECEVPDDGTYLSIAQSRSFN